MSYFFNLSKRESRNENSENSSQNSIFSNDQVQQNQTQPLAPFYSAENIIRLLYDGLLNNSSDLKMFPLSELKRAGIYINRLLEAGFAVNELLSVFTIEEILNHDSHLLPVLLDAGVKAEQFENSGDLGFEIKNLQAIRNARQAVVNSGMTEAQMIALGDCDLCMYRGFTKDDVLSTGATLAQLIRAGFSLQFLHILGFDARDLRIEGYRINDLRRAELSDEEILHAGYSASELRLAKYSASELFAI